MNLYKEIKCRLCDSVYKTKNSFCLHLNQIHHITLSVYHSEQVDDVDILKCELCELRSNNLLTHIKHTHLMKISDYREMFPNAKVYRFTNAQIQQLIKARSAKNSNNKKFKLECKRRVDETLATGVKMLKCRLCDYESALSIISHITRKHGIKMDVYRTQYPNDTVQRSSPSHKLNNSLAMKKKLQNPMALKAFMNWRSFPSEIKHWIKKGLTPEQAQEKVSEFQKCQSYKGRNEKTKAKQSANSSGEKNPMSLKSIAKRNGITEQCARELTPCFGRVGKKHPMFGKKHTEEALEKIASAYHLSNPSYRSKAEIEIADFCSTLDNIENNVHIKRWNVDVRFLSKKIIVEFFGDYWHMNPQKYTCDKVHNLMRKSAQEIWDRDARKLYELHAQGYDVIVIWESEWNLNKNECMQRIKDAFNRTL